MSGKLVRTALAAVLVSGGAQAATINYADSETVSTPLTLTEDTTISVASGKTVVYDAAATVSGGFTLKVRTATVEVDGEMVPLEIGTHDGSKGPLEGRLVGGGTLAVRGANPGMLLIVR